MTFVKEVFYLHIRIRTWLLSNFEQDSSFSWCLNSHFCRKREQVNFKYFSLKKHSKQGQAWLCTWISGLINAVNVLSLLHQCFCVCSLVAFSNASVILLLSSFISPLSVFANASVALFWKFDMSSGFCCLLVILHFTIFTLSFWIFMLSNALTILWSLPIDIWFSTVT